MNIIDLALKHLELLIGYLPFVYALWLLFTLTGGLLFDRK